jgi:hypothetical protein
MLEKKVLKLWRGKYVSVRDYEVTLAKKKGGLIIEHKNEYMILDNEKLTNLKPNVKVQSNYKGTYRLVDIEWKPDTKNHKQGNLI